jgi:hypothetical protein
MIAPQIATTWMNNMSRSRSTTALATPLAFTLGLSCSLPNTAAALSFEAGDWLFNVDTTLTAAAQWRTESRDKKLSTHEDNLNLNDGNNNFDTGLVSAKGSFILEVGGEYGDFSFFLRGDGLYDYAYEQMDSDLSRENYLTYNSAVPNGGDVKRGDFPDGTLDEHGKRLRLLEAFINYEFDLGEQSGSIRAGRQVIAWGEAILYQGVNAIQNPIDAGVALSPGVEAKEIFLPTGAVNLKWNFTDFLSAEAYYKLEWEESTLPGVGSFLSPADITGPGAERVLLAPGLTGKVTSADDPSDSGQWGTALRYVTEGGTSFTASYTRSHANTPGNEFVLDFADLGSTFTRDVYLEGIHFWQVAANTTWGEASVYADFAYSDNAPFVDRTQFLNEQGKLVASSTTRGHYRQLVLGMTDLYTAFTWLSEQIILTAEVIYQSNNLGESKREDAPYGITEDAWGYRFNMSLKYFSVLPGMDLEIPLSFRHDVDGYGASVIQNSLLEGQKWAGIGARAIYLENWEFDAKYSFYFGNDDPGDPVLSDRDNLTLSAKYRF